MNFFSISMTATKQSITWHLALEIRTQSACNIRAPVTENEFLFKYRRSYFTGARYLLVLLTFWNSIVGASKRRAPIMTYDYEPTF